ncbi:hypothetical protein MIR68_011732 [Amoeboaphelidium protococcarum]|nr:hypothetical protein MIR68_011732 [Amoeboaphelidium protococcarum]
MPESVKSRQSAVENGTNYKASSNFKAGGRPKSNTNISSGVNADQSVHDAVKAILDADENVSWAIFKLENGQVQTRQKGNGDLDQLKAGLRDDEVSYGYLRQPIGSDRRNKYVFIKWVGESVRPIQRARALDDCKKIQEVVKTFHIELSANKPSDLNEKALIERLQKAAGANYDKEQNAASAAIDQSVHEFGNYKRSSKEFFQQMEKSGTVKSIVYETKALPKSTPVDLGNRSMTVGASSARANTVDLKIVKEDNVAN